MPKIELLNEDCMIVMARYPDNYFDLACVDPPYGIGMENSKSRTKPSRPNSYRDGYGIKYIGKSWDKKAPEKEYFIELMRVSKHQVIWGANYFNEFLPSGFGWIYWDKKNGIDNCFSDGELAFSSKGVQTKSFSCSAFYETKGGKERIHPTQKPTQLYKWILKNYAKEGDRILDTHLGSGSSAIAAHYGGFDFVGMELDKDYYDAACKRFDEETAQQALAL